MHRVRLEVDNTHVVERTMTYQGKPLVFREQEAYAFLLAGDGSAARYPTLIKVGLEVGQQPYAKGLYLLSGTSLFVDKYGKLAIGRLRLAAVPVVQGVSVKG